MRLFAGALVVKAIGARVRLYANAFILIAFEIVFDEGGSDSMACKRTIDINSDNDGASYLKSSLWMTNMDREREMKRIDGRWKIEEDGEKTEKSFVFRWFIVMCAPRCVFYNI